MSAIGSDPTKKTDPEVLILTPEVSKKNWRGQSQGQTYPPVNKIEFVSQVKEAKEHTPKIIVTTFEVNSLRRQPCIEETLAVQKSIAGPPPIIEKKVQDPKQILDDLPAITEKQMIAVRGPVKS